MKGLYALLALFVAATASAEETVVKECTARIELPMNSGEDVDN